MAESRKPPFHEVLLQSLRTLARLFKAASDPTAEGYAIAFVTSARELASGFIPPDLRENIATRLKQIIALFPMHSEHVYGVERIQDEHALWLRAISEGIPMHAVVLDALRERITEFSAAFGTETDNDDLLGMCEDIAVLAILLGQVLIADDEREQVASELDSLLLELIHGSGEDWVSESGIFERAGDWVDEVRAAIA